LIIYVPFSSVDLIIAKTNVKMQSLLSIMDMQTIYEGFIKNILNNHDSEKAAEIFTEFRGK
jgi:hypothetical protein